MSRFGQVGIAVGALGIVIALMGLFPGIAGVEETLGIGVVQVFMLLMGYGLLVFGAIIYIKFTFYTHVDSNLTQQIGTRLALTGLLFGALAGLSDILGFGSHVRTETTDIFFGYWQAFGILASFAISSFGVLLYTVAGDPQLSETSQIDDIQASADARATQQAQSLRESLLADETAPNTETPLDPQPAADPGDAA